MNNYKILFKTGLVFISFAILTSLSGKSRKAQGKNIIDPNKQTISQSVNKQLIAKQLIAKQLVAKQLVAKPTALSEPIENIESKMAEDPIPIVKKRISETVDEASKQEPFEDEPSKKEPSKNDEEIYINFENAEFESFLNYIAEFKKINILPTKSLKGHKISLTIRKPVGVDQAWNILQTVSDMAGLSIVKVGDVYKIIPKGTKLTEPLPTFINVPIETLPDSDENIRYLTFLNNIKVEDIAKSGGLLQSMLSKTSLVIPYTDSNCIVMSDKSLNIKSAMKIISELDKSGLQEAVVVMRLKETNAEDVKTLLDSLMNADKPTLHPIYARIYGGNQEKQSTYFAPGTKIITDNRTNSLILLGTKTAVETIETFIKENIDKALTKLESPLHVYELNYMDATQLVKMLKDVTQAPTSKLGASAAKYGSVRGGVKYFKPITFQADTENNRIIVSTSDKNDWKLTKELIKNLDKPQPQVTIEALIVTVDMTDDKSFGGQTRNKAGMLGKNVNFQSPPLNTTVLKSDGTNAVSVLGDLITGLSGALGKTLLTFGRETNIWSIFEILEKQTNASVVAKPFLTVANKYQAFMKTGEIRRITMSEIAATSTADAQEGKEDINANIELSVVPQINIDGIINLDISIKNDVFAGSSGGDRTTRLLSTKVSVANGQVIALGGLIKNKVTESVSKTPLLGDIPVLGWLFKNKSRTVTKENLLIFLSPTIVKPRKTQGLNLYTQIKLDEAKKTVAMGTEYLENQDIVDNWFFDLKKQRYTKKVVDYGNARFQPVTVDIKNDSYYKIDVKKDRK